MIVAVNLECSKDLFFNKKNSRGEKTDKVSKPLTDFLSSFENIDMFLSTFTCTNTVITNLSENLSTGKKSKWTELKNGVYHGILPLEAYEYLEKTASENKTISGYTFSISRFMPKNEANNSSLVIFYPEGTENVSSVYLRYWIISAVENQLRKLVKVGYISEMPTLFVKKNFGIPVGNFFKVHFSQTEEFEKISFAKTCLNMSIFTPKEFRDEKYLVPYTEHHLQVPWLGVNWERKVESYTVIKTNGDY